MEEEPQYKQLSSVSKHGSQNYKMPLSLPECMARQSKSLCRLAFLPESIKTTQINREIESRISMLVVAVMGSNTFN